MVVARENVNGWSQSSMLPPEHLRIEVTIHLSAGGQRAQVGIDVTDFSTDVQLGLSTWRIDVIGGTDELLESVDEALSIALQEWWFPF